MKIVQMMRDAGASEVHFRVASPPTGHGCYYGVDTPERSKLLAGRMDVAAMCEFIHADSLAFVSIDGLLPRGRARRNRNNACPQYCDACFTGDYPTALTDLAERRPGRSAAVVPGRQGRLMPAGHCSTVAGRVALVTGASRGIGAATAKALGAAGAHVVVTARKARSLEAVEEEIHAGRRHRHDRADGSDRKRSDRPPRHRGRSERWGRLDVARDQRARCCLR